MGESRRGFARTRVFSYNLASYDATFGFTPEKPHSRLWIWAIALGLAIASLPSFKVARVVRVQAPGPLPNVIQAGLPITVADRGGEIEALELEGRALSRVKGTDLFLGGVGLYDHDVVVLRGLLRQNKTSIEDGPIGLIYASPLREFAHNIRVEKPVDGNPSALRLPAAIALQSTGLAGAERRTLEAAKVRERLAREDGDADIGCWSSPLDTSMISDYGSWRSLPNGESYAHAGVDLRAPTGTPIKAVGAGELDMAEELLIPGKMAMVYHGGGIFTRYMHMSSFLSRQGEKITGGQTLGYSGATGRAEGPHLHWEILWKGKALNPTAFLDLSRQLCAKHASR